LKIVASHVTDIAGASANREVIFVFFTPDGTLGFRDMSSSEFESDLHLAKTVRKKGSALDCN
jgi:hypothetical protein